MKAKKLMNEKERFLTFSSPFFNRQIFNQTSLKTQESLQLEIVLTRNYILIALNIQDRKIKLLEPNWSIIHSVSWKLTSTGFIWHEWVQNYRYLTVRLEPHNNIGSNPKCGQLSTAKLICQELNARTSGLQKIILFHKQRETKPPKCTKKKIGPQSRYIPPS